MGAAPSIDPQAAPRGYSSGPSQATAKAMKRAIQYYTVDDVRADGRCSSRWTILEDGTSAGIEGRMPAVSGHPRPADRANIELPNFSAAEEPTISRAGPPTSRAGDAGCAQSHSGGGVDPGPSIASGGESTASLPVRLAASAMLSVWHATHRKRMNVEERTPGRV